MPAVVIHRYVKVGGDGVGKSKAHIRYIQYRRGEDKERSADDPSGPKKREMFDGERDSVNRHELDQLIDRERQGQVAIHKLTLSPGIEGVDMKEYTREVMDELGKSKGLELQWAAVVHQNTEHDHAHVVILGSDKNRDQVRIERSDHDLLRYKSDQYLEREHALDRELDREFKEVERVAREKGLEHEDDRLGKLFGKGRDGEREPELKEPGDRDKPIEILYWDEGAGDGETLVWDKDSDLKDLKSLAKSYDGEKEKSITEQEYERLKGWIEDKERPQERAQVRESWSKERAIEGLSEREKIAVAGETYTKYSTAQELKGLDEHLKTHFEDRVDKQQYAMMQRWIEAKERNGDDCHELWDKKRYESTEKEQGREAGQAAQSTRDWHELDKSARKAYDDQSGVIARRFPRQQRIYEERGRNEEFHITYQNNMAKQRLMEAQERTNDPEILKYIDKELEFLKEYRKEAQRDIEPIDLEIGADYVRKCLRIIQLLEIATQPEDMNIVGFRFHGLKGNPQRWSVRVTGNYRITFGWSGENALNVDFEDYH